MGSLATNSWIELLWEKIRAFNIDVDLNYKAIKLLMKHDMPIMQLMVDKCI